MDPKSNLEEWQTDSTRRFQKDKSAQEKLANTLVLSEVLATDYDTLFIPGGHGPM